MIRRHASLIVAALLVILVAGACIVRTGRTSRRSQPTYVEKHKHKKHKHKKHRGGNRGRNDRWR